MDKSVLMSRLEKSRLIFVNSQSKCNSSKGFAFRENVFLSQIKKRY